MDLWLLLHSVVFSQWQTNTIILRVCKSPMSRSHVLTPIFPDNIHLSPSSIASGVQVHLPFITNSYLKMLKNHSLQSSTFLTFILSNCNIYAFFFRYFQKHSVGRGCKSSALVFGRVNTTVNILQHSNYHHFSFTDLCSLQQFNQWYMLWFLQIFDL